MKETDVLGLFLSRRDNYDVSHVAPFHGHLYDVAMKGTAYKAVLLVSSFDYYERRYHLATTPPTLVICFEHTTVLPLPVLSMRRGHFAEPYELPSEITDIKEQRWTRVGHRVLLGMYLSGMKAAHALVKELPPSTRNRYLSKVKTLSKRTRGRPVVIEKKNPIARARKASAAR